MASEKKQGEKPKTFVEGNQGKITHIVYHLKTDGKHYLGFLVGN
jgi:hypothetical protein